MTKLKLTGALTAAIAGSALLTGVAFASDEMLNNGTSGGGNAISALAHSTTAVGEEKGDVISAAAQAQNDNKPADVDEDNDENNEVDKDNDENEVDTDKDEAADNEANKDNDEHGQTVSTTAISGHHGEKHSDRGR
jgi:hypothetical protein